MESKRSIIFLNIIFLIFTWAITIHAYGDLPYRVPSHFDFNGQPTDWTDKTPVMFFIMPVIATLMVLFMVFFTKYPQLYNFPQKIQVQYWPEEKKKPIYDFISKMILYSALFINLTFLLVQYSIIEGAEEGVLPGSRMWLILASVFIWLPIITVMFVGLNKIVEETKKASSFRK